MSDSATIWTVIHQSPLSLGFSRQEYWSRLPCPPPGDLPSPGIKPASLALAGEFFTTSATWEVGYRVEYNLWQKKKKRAGGKVEMETVFPLRIFLENVAS